MMRPGGIIRLWDVVYDFPPNEFEQRIEAWCQQYPVDPAAGAWGRADLVEHVRDEHSTFTWLLEPMLEQAGLEVDDVEVSNDRLFAKYVARRS